MTTQAATTMAPKAAAPVSANEKQGSTRTLISVTFCNARAESLYCPEGTAVTAHEAIHS